MAMDWIARGCVSRSIVASWEVGQVRGQTYGKHGWFPLKDP